MARRVQLDLMERDGTDDVPLDGPAAEGGPSLQPDAAPETKPSLMARFLMWLSQFRKAKGGIAWKSLLNWKILLPAGAGLVLLVSIVIAYTVYRHEESARLAAEERKRVESAATPAVREAVFADFSIDLIDPKGQFRFLECEVTLEFQSETQITEDKRVDVRRAIYLAARKAGYEQLRRSVSGAGLKNGLREELKTIFGNEALKEIYITKYVLI